MKLCERNCIPVCNNCHWYWDDSYEGGDVGEGQCLLHGIKVTQEYGCPQMTCISLMPDYCEEEDEC